MGTNFKKGDGWWINEWAKSFPGLPNVECGSVICLSALIFFLLGQLFLSLGCRWILGLTAVYPRQLEIHISLLNLDTIISEVIVASGI